MEKPACAERKIRLLTIASREWSSMSSLAGLAALPGFELIGDAVDCNDGLRQALMTRPDVIVLPWSAPALKLRSAIAYLRDENRDEFGSPLMVAVAEAGAPPDRFTPHDGIVVVGMERFNGGLAEGLRLLLAARERPP
jgi:hypothetical protein